ncbi:MAG: circularly permuted type 2 ATP-grasp protein, partial [Ginsengibacter sp.]
MSRNFLLQSYREQPGVWDEMHGDGSIRSPYKNFVSAIADLPVDEMTHKDEMAKKLFMSQGVTFTVYNSGEGIEKIFPFDIIPRIITS